MILIGVDIENISRFEALLNKECFTGGVFTKDELLYISKKPARAAGIWCAKEACAKALGEGLYGLLPKDIEVLHDEKGAPALKLHGGAFEKYGKYSFSVSITHSGDTAFSAVAAEKQDIELK